MTSAENNPKVVEYRAEVYRNGYQEILYKTHECEQFCLTMKIIVHEELGYVDFSVKLTNKRNGRCDMKVFEASLFQKAIEYYDRQYKIFVAD